MRAPPSVKGLLKEYGSNASISITRKEKKEKAYFPWRPLVELPCCPEGLRIRQEHLCNATRDLSTSVHFHNLVTKWLMTRWQDHVSLIQRQSPIHYQNKEGDSCVCQWEMGPYLRSWTNLHHFCNISEAWPLKIQCRSASQGVCTVETDLLCFLDDNDHTLKTHWGMLMLYANVLLNCIS